MNKLSTVPANGNVENAPAVIGIDVAKNVFAVHAVNRHGKAVLVRPQVRRNQLLDLLAQLAPCIIGLEACSGALHWARQLAALGHTPKLMVPKSIIPYRIQGKRGKDDANDAAAAFRAGPLNCKFRCHGINYGRFAKASARKPVKRASFSVVVSRRIS